MKIIITLVLGLFFSAHSRAQSANISGTVTDPNENKLVKNAVVALLTPKDSILYAFCRSDASGQFILKNIKPGKFILMTTHPFFADLVEDIDISNDAKLPPINLISKSTLLREVIIKSGSGVSIRGATTVYTADSFKVSANANVEE